MVRLEFRAMGCQMLAMVDSDHARAEQTLAQVPVWFEAWEQSLSRFRVDSELNRLNAHAGESFQVSEILGQVLEQALIAARISDGLVTPAVLNALERAGYDRNFELIQTREPASPSSIGLCQSRANLSFRAEREILFPSERRFLLAKTARRNDNDNALPSSIAPVADWRAIEYDAETRVVCLPREMRLDLGGIAKGWAADQAARRLSQVAPALVDAGGDIAISGPLANGEPWQIAVADPFNPDGDVERLVIDAGGVATSGRDYRNWKMGERVYHHIIDPHTGQPAETDVVSATVIAPSALQAETAAKVALILGHAAGMRWLNARPLLAGLLVLDDHRVVASARLDDFVWRAALATAPSYLFGS
ncbi:MAG: FAD:protein FMN transferase [Chloroflexi bacterium]|nr:FAD:protein FMN transferase [Chloroflexota bacterium]